MISIILNILIFMFASFVCEHDSQRSYNIDLSFDLAYFGSHSENYFVSVTLPECSNLAKMSHMKDGLEILFACSLML